MGLRIQTNVEALNVYGKLNKTNSRVAQSLERLSSGFRINSAKDDVSGFATANAFKAKISSLRVAQQNTSEANSFLQVYDGGYNKIHDILIRMKDLATQAASGQAADTTDRINEEFAMLQSEIDRIASSTTYSTEAAGSSADSMNHLNGAGTDTVTFQIGASYTTDSGVQSANTLEITLDAACSTSLGVDTGSISVDSQTNAQTAMEAIDSALSTINESMGKVGAYQNRLSYTHDNLATTIENLSSSESVIRDVDMAKETMEFTKNQILQQSGMAMLSQANMAPQQVLQLLG